MRNCDHTEITVYEEPAQDFFPDMPASKRHVWKNSLVLAQPVVSMNTLLPNSNPNQRGREGVG